MYVHVEYGVGEKSVATGLVQLSLLPAWLVGIPVFEKRRRSASELEETPAIRLLFRFLDFFVAGCELFSEKRATTRDIIEDNVDFYAVLNLYGQWLKKWNLNRHLYTYLCFLFLCVFFFSNFRYIIIYFNILGNINIYKIMCLN